MDVGADRVAQAKAMATVPDSAKRETRRLRAPWLMCPTCGAEGEIIGTGTAVISYLSPEPTHVTHYQCENGHQWQFPPPEESEMR